MERIHNPSQHRYAMCEHGVCHKKAHYLVSGDREKEDWCDKPRNKHICCGKHSPPRRVVYV